MQFVYDKDGNRISPSKGAIGYCPVCKGEMVAACGEILIHHWKHKKRIVCDPWKEHETKWHRDWKSEFPEKWQEVRIVEDDEIHIADVKTDYGLVIEFQNSPISSTTIHVRERFYDNMIWVVNAEKFQSNIIPYPIVTKKLSQISDVPFYGGSIHSDTMDECDEKIPKLIKEASNYDYESHLLDHEIFEFEEYLVQLEESVRSVIYRSIPYNSKLQAFRSEEFSNYEITENKIKEVESKQKQVKSKLDLIHSLPFSSIDECCHMKEVTFDQVSESNYGKCRIVERSKENTLFPEFKALRSVRDFNWYRKQEDKFKLLIDLTENLKSLEKELLGLEENHEGLINDKTQSYNLLKEELERFIRSTIQKKNSMKFELKGKAEKLKTEINELESVKEEAIKNHNLFTKKETKRIEDERKKERSRIMRTYKGVYGYRWKHRRPTWDFAKCPVYLDFKSHLFEIKNDIRLKKISRADFIRKFSSLENLYKYSN